MKRKIGFLALTIVLAAVGAGFIWRLVNNKASPLNPLTPSVIASVSFPLYYPTRLPPGFHTNLNSVEQPDTGVIIFEIDGAAKQKIYVSEEAPPQKFSFSGFYESFVRSQKTVDSMGVIESGYIKSNKHQTAVASINTEKTWILINSNSYQNANQLNNVAKSLTLAQST